MMQFKVVQNIIKDMQAETANIKTSLFTCLRVTGFNSMQKMRSDLKAGRLGLVPLTPYRNNMRYSKKYPDHDPRYRSPRNVNVNTPMAYMAGGIRYNAIKSQGIVEIGFLQEKSPKRFLQAVAALNGFRTQISSDKKVLLHTQGIHLRKSTSSIAVPARDPVGNFYRLNEAAMGAQIATNFARKMRGERI